MHLPWWIWAIATALIAMSVVERAQRARRKDEHRAYLNSLAWRQTRREALNRAGGRCEDCGSTRKLHVHHLTYARHGREKPRDLRVLCSRCHRRRHREGGRFDDRMDLMFGWTTEARRRRRS
jgi:5-methylcytosine-specific restriction endonuclease McrA